MRIKTRQTGTLLLAALLCAVILSATPAPESDPAKEIAGIYEGKTNIELLQAELPLQVVLERVHKDSVVVVITDFALPTGQKFNFRSPPLSVKAGKKAGKTVYTLYTTFTHTYNKMPLKVTANATITEGELDSQVKGNLMEAMETSLTYKARKK